MQDRLGGTTTFTLRIPSRARLLAVAVLVALSTAGCLGRDKADITGSISAPSTPRSEDAWRASAEEWGHKYDDKPGDKQASLNYARALRALEQRQQAVAVLENAALKAPKDRDILAAYGKALAENGDLQQAQDVLSRAHSPERPDWRILSAQGAVADQLGDHDGAQGYYSTALKIRPDDPGILSNLGLSLALARRLPEAEQTLRQAVQQPGADMRARQNLALVLGLQGKFAEAEQLARQDLPPAEAAQSVASIKQMIAQPNSWKSIRAADARGKPPGSIGSKPAPAAQARKPAPLDLGADPG
jgi:Flp pilus assembly protein TadD